MIVDCHTHIWDSTAQLGEGVEAATARGVVALGAGPQAALVDASADHHRAASAPVDKSFVLAFKSRYLDAEIPNALVSQYVRQDPDRLIGFAGIDPTDVRAAIAEMHEARNTLGLRGVTVSPAAQDYHPTDSRAMRIFAEAAGLRMPVLVHQGTHFSVASKMEYARPCLFDEVAREFPTLKLIIAHLGYPWVDECVALVGKHPNVFADISGLMHRPWQAYNALLTAYEYGVMDKLLFGSDFPYTSATACIESLYSINRVVLGTSLPTVPRPLLRGIVERDALALLGLSASAARRDASVLLNHHDD